MNGTLPGTFGVAGSGVVARPDRPVAELLHRLGLDLPSVPKIGKRQRWRLLTTGAKVPISDRRCHNHIDEDVYAVARRTTRCWLLTQASGVMSLTCQLVIEGRRVKTSRR